MESAERFTNRVQDYVAYRPGYPAEIVQTLHKNHGLTTNSVIADIGFGTGNLAEIFLQFGCAVIGIEPNATMRRAGVNRLAQYKEKLSVIAAAAEATTLENNSVDFITAGQAYHWFDPEKSQAEFRRILRPEKGCVALVWNDRRLSTTPFQIALEEIIRQYSIDYQNVDTKHLTSEALKTRLGANGELVVYEFENKQVLSLEAFLGRIRSASYTPTPDHPNFKPMMVELRDIFRKYNQVGKISIDYDTRVYVAQM